MPSTGDAPFDVIASPKSQRRRRSATYRGAIDVIVTATRAAIVMICHAVLSAVVVTSMWSIQKLIELYGDGQSMLIYGRYPFEYIFQTIDVFVVIALGILGLTETINVLRGKNKR
jgi:hypothetical protein